MVDEPESVPPASPEEQEPAQCCVQWAPLPSPAAHWPVSPQEDVLNTQCGYDVRLKLVSRQGQGPGSWGHWDGKGSRSISSPESGFCGEGVPIPRTIQAHRPWYCHTWGSGPMGMGTGVFAHSNSLLSTTGCWAVPWTRDSCSCDRQSPGSQGAPLQGRERQEVPKSRNVSSSVTISAKSLEENKIKEVMGLGLGGQGRLLGGGASVPRPR